MKSYRWVVSPDSNFVVFIAEKEGVKGRKIEVYINSEINSYWTKFPDVEGINMRIIKPKDAESIIKQALNLGWVPDQKDSPMVFDLIDDELIKRE
ncbi:hypothetical protein KFE94_07570 [bacterium SCSIO 12643]|nr:hypothetical protein KFE94_07570 [bacterium SCSIO 12643]